MQCDKCNASISPSRKIVCNACNAKYHPSCTELKTMTNYKSVNNWVCEKCSDKKKNFSASNNRSIIKESNITSNFEFSGDLNLDSLKSILNNVIIKIEELSKTVKSVEKSIGFCSDQIDEFSVKLESAMKKISIMETKIENFEINNNKLSKEVKMLKSKINNQEQAMLSSNFEISNFPKTQNENINEIVKSVANILNCKIENNDIIESFRLKNKSNKEGIIIVRLNSKSIKDSIMNNIKLRVKNKSPLTAKEIYSKFNDTQIFINDQLTQYNKKLLWLSKELCKRYKFKYTWANNGGVFIRKQEGEQVFKILNIETLQQLDVNKCITTLWED